MVMVSTLSRTHHKALFSSFFVEVIQVLQHGHIDNAVSLRTRRPHLQLYCVVDFLV